MKKIINNKETKNSLTVGKSTSNMAIETTVGSDFWKQ